MRVVLYRRVSTDDKGQDPHRQDAILQACVQRDRHEVVATVSEEESAGEKAKPTLDRPGVKEALSLARKHKADAILVENVDRWTRKGPNDLGYSHFVLARDHDGLKLLFADLPDDDLVRLVLPPLMAALAFMDNRRRSDMARTSAAKRKAQGVRVGRPPKPGLTEEEVAIVSQMQAEGRGLRAIAVRLSQHRGAHEVADAKARRFRTITAPWLQTELHTRTEIHGLLVRVPRPSHGRAHRNGAVPIQPEAAA